MQQFICVTNIQYLVYLYPKYTLGIPYDVIMMS